MGTAVDYRRLPLEEMEAIVKRFENRVSEGLQKAPPTRDVVKKAVRRQNPAYCPCRLNRLSTDIIVRHGDSLADLFYEYPDDIVFVNPCMGTIQVTLFERLHFVRGMENIFEDVHIHEKEVRRLADGIMEFNLELVKLWGRLGPDGLLLTDDWGTQTTLMISPEMWRRIFKPYYKALFDAIHREGMDVCLHSCGNVTEIVGDLIDIGLDILDPLQPEAMDLKEIARRFGGHITFHGAIDDQRLLNRATPQELKDNIHWLVETLGKPFGNGFVLCPATSISPETPMENLRALFEACHEQ